MCLVTEKISRMGSIVGKPIPSNDIIWVLVGVMFKYWFYWQKSEFLSTYIIYVNTDRLY